MGSSVTLYHRHRSPAEIISHCVWLYFRFALSFRDVEEMSAMWQADEGQQHSYPLYKTSGQETKHRLGELAVFADLARDLVEGGGC